MFIPVAAGSVFFIMIFGPLYNHKLLPPKWMLVFSSLFLLTGILLFSRNTTHSFYWRWTFSGSVVIPLGVTIFFINYLNIVYASAPAEDQGLISGIVQTVAQISTGVAFAVGSSFIRGERPEVLLGQYRKSFYVAMAFAGAGAVVAALFVKTVKKREGQGEGKGKSDVESVATPEDSPSVFAEPDAEKEERRVAAQG